jgi:hypothetical protein
MLLGYMKNVIFTGYDLSNWNRANLARQSGSSAVHLTLRFQAQHTRKTSSQEEVKMKIYLTGLVAAGFLAAAVAQVNSQTGASGSSQTSVSASQSGVNANSSNSANANQDVKAGKKDANASGSASQDSAAGAQIPSGTKVPAVLDKSVDSRKCKQGDEVVAKTTQDVVSGGKVIIPKNSKLIGHVTEASAKANGESDSKLGIVFDKAMLRNGSTVPMQAHIQALAAPAVSAANSMSSDDSMGGGSSPTTSARSGGGGLGSTVGGVTGAAGGAVDTVGSTAGGATSGVGSTVNSTTGATTGAVGNVAGNTTSAAGALTSNSSGVIGMKNLQLNSDNSSSATGSVITSTGKNVKLDSGSRMVLAVTGSSQTSQ